MGGDNDQSDLADALGITVEELQAAQAKAQAARLAQAVEDGTLTQDQANLMLAMQALRGVIDHEAIMADALGLTVDELQAAMTDGTLRDLLANITPAELQAKMQAALHRGRAAGGDGQRDHPGTGRSRPGSNRQPMGLAARGMRGGHGHGGHGFRWRHARLRRTAGR